MFVWLDDHETPLSSVAVAADPLLIVPEGLTVCVPPTVKRIELGDTDRDASVIGADRPVELR